MAIQPGVTRALAQSLRIKQVVDDRDSNRKVLITRRNDVPARDATMSEAPEKPVVVVARKFPE